MSGTTFRSPHTSNRIYLLRNCFSNYVYLKDTYIIFEGIGKILFLLVLAIILISKFLNFTAMFTKTINFPKLSYNFSYEKVNFSIINPTHSVKSVRIRSYSGPYFHAFGLRIPHISPYSVRMRENTAQNNSEYGHFLRSNSNFHS